MRKSDIDTYRKLIMIGKSKGKNIELGNKPEKLMQHDSYKREGRKD